MSAQKSEGNLVFKSGALGSFCSRKMKRTVKTRRIQKRHRSGGMNRFFGNRDFEQSRSAFLPKAADVATGDISSR